MCGGQAVYKRIYSNKMLCQRCFVSSIIRKTKRTISKYKMLSHGDNIAVAVSGGKDSLSLLTVLSEICISHGSKLQAITIDEGIDGYRIEAVNIATNHSTRLKIPQFTISFKECFNYTLDEALSIERKTSSCSICGVLRRRAIDIAAQKIGANVVATAHNLDDVIQTFFINLLSGDLKRVRWLKPSLEAKSEFGMRRIKPFMEIYEAEIAFYAFLKEIPFQSARCPYRDESIRSEIREVLNTFETKHPGVKYSLLKTSLGISQNLKVDVDSEIKNCHVCNYPSSDDTCAVCRTIELISASK